MIGSSPKNQADARRTAPERVCDHPDCAEAGEHRAPRSRDQLDIYYWFCRDHARYYNAAWNFFGDMDRSAIEDYQKADLTWHRPTWRFGVNRQVDSETRLNAAWRRGNVTDFYGVFDDEEAPCQDAGSRRMRPEEREALAVLNLPSAATAGDIKARYKALVKRLHPDVNGDDKQAVNKLLVVIKAYRTLSRRSNP